MRNRHHVLFPRSLHNATDVGFKLRTNNLLIPRIDVDAHAELHENVSIVPPLPNEIGSRTLRLMSLCQSRTNLQAIDNYMLSVEDAADHPRATDLDRKLGELVVESVYQQIPYIEKGQKTAFIDLKPRKIYTTQTS